MMLYHYTTEKRLELIRRTQEFKPSTNTIADATYGGGWYFTDLPPTACERQRMYACWRTTTFHQRVRYYLKLDINSAALRNVREHVWFVPLGARLDLRLLSEGETPNCCDDRSQCTFPHIPA